jgi:type II secretory pathway pseudopilin PulG
MCINPTNPVARMKRSVIREIAPGFHSVSSGLHLQARSDSGRFVGEFVGWGERCPANPNKVCDSRSPDGAQRTKSSGFTLIESIVIIVVISIAAVGLLGVFTKSVTHSADPMLRMQAAAIAQGYLEEAMLKSFTDPDQPETGTCEAGEARATYDDVQDYNCVNDTAGALDQFGAGLAGLGAYNVDVNVTAAAIGGVPTQQIEVVVTHDSQAAAAVTLIGHRTAHF